MNLVMTMKRNWKKGINGEQSVQALGNFPMTGKPNVKEQSYKKE